MVTIKQIADLAGVSRGTVDRVLNNLSGVNPETEVRVRKILTALNYSPSKAGQNLAIKKKNLKFGYVISAQSGSNPFFNEVEKGIKKKALELGEYGITVEIAFSNLSDYQQQLQILDRLVEHGVSGIAITPTNHPAIAQRLRELTDRGIAIVTSNSDIENSGRLAYVGSNYYKCGETAGGLLALFSQGHANVGIVYGSDSVLCHSQRIAGFQDRIASCPDIKVITAVKNNDDDIESYSVTKTILETYPEIDSLFLVSAGVHGACHAAVSSKRNPIIICYDCLPETRALLQKGIIYAAIDQQPMYQGSKPLDILFDAVALNMDAHAQALRQLSAVRLVTPLRQ